MLTHRAIKDAAGGLGTKKTIAAINRPRNRTSASKPADDFVDDEPPVTRTPVTMDDTDFSNWDVPSWQDLISSLHRPDR